MSALLLLALGCTTDEGASTAPAGDPTPSVLTDPEAPFLSEPTTDDTEVDMAALAVSVNDAITYALELDPAPLLDAYRNVMDGAEPGCPTFYEDDGLVYWLDTCSTGSGASYDGFGLDDVLLGVDLGDGMITDLVTAGGVATVTGTSGYTVDLNGFVQVLSQVSPDGLVTVDQTVLTGDFSTDDPVADGTWLAEGVSPNIVLTQYSIAGAGDASIVSGVIEGLSGPFPTVVFDEAVISNLEVGLTDCEIEPSGSVSVQLQTGDWVDILFDPEFDGELVTTDEVDRCDGCGRAWHQTRDLGEACFDFSPWID